MRKVDGNQSKAAGETRDRDVKPHSDRLRIKGEAPLDFTATLLDSIEVAEALPRRKVRLVLSHSLFDVGGGPHLHVKAQFRLDLVRDFIGMLPGVNEIYCGFESGHWFSVRSVRPQSLHGRTRESLPILLFDH